LLGKPWFDGKRKITAFDGEPTKVEKVLVPEAGLEPARGISPVDFESTASTDFATRAGRDWSEARL
jgi:hypothetical protein